MADRLTRHSTVHLAPGLEGPGDRMRGYRLLAASAAGRRTRMRMTAMRSIAAVLVTTAAGLRGSISTGVRRCGCPVCCVCME